MTTSILEVAPEPPAKPARPRANGRNCAAVAAIGISLSWLIRYADGCGGSPSLLELPFVAGAVLCALIAIVVYLWSAIAHRQFPWQTPAVLLLAVALWAAPMKVMPDPFLLGLKHSILGAMTPDELRAAASKSGELLHGQILLRDPGPSTGAPLKEQQVWAEFAALPGVSKLAPNFTVSSWGGEGMFLHWGGGFGYWGVVVLPVDPKETVNTKHFDGRIIRASINGDDEEEGYRIWAWQPDIWFVLEL